MTCATAEALLATRLVEAAAEPPAELASHLGECSDCKRLARELENPVVADTLAGVVEAAVAPLELAVVPRENYVRGKEIGRGGMGRIVRATDRRLGRTVAIKELLDDRLRARFEHEARLTARLQHPAIVSVHEAGRWPSGEPFYAMKYVAGRPLDLVLRAAGTFADRLALLPNFITVADAIAYAHSERIVHRDLKPQNIVVGSFGETVVVDWGLAREIDEPAPDEERGPYRGDAFTQQGAGTPAYMSPEQARGDEPDERMDVFALGATLYHLVTGAAPAATLAMGEAPAELATVIRKAMAAAPADRYPTARELADDLRRFQNGQLVGAHRYTLGTLVRRFVRRHRVLLGAAALFVAALGAVGAVSLQRVLVARDEANRAYAEVLVERGRQQLVEGSPARALPELLAARARGLDTPLVRFLVAEASRTTEGLLLALDWKDVRQERFQTVCAAVSPDGTVLLAGNQVWDVATRKLRMTLPHARVRAVAIDRRGDRLVTVGDWTIVWDAHTGRRLFWVDETLGITQARFGPDGALLLHNMNQGYLFDRDGHGRAFLDGRYTLGAVGWSEDGTRILAGDHDVRIFDAATGDITYQRVTFGGPAFVGISSEGIVVAAKDEVTVLTLRGSRTIHVDGPIEDFAVLGGGDTIFVRSYRQAALLDLHSGRQKAILAEGTTASAAFPDATAVVLGGADGVARVFFADGQPGERFEGGAAIESLAVTPTRLLTIERGGLVKVWRLGAREPVALPSGVTEAAFDDQGRLTTTSARDTQLWSAADGRYLGTPPGGPRVSSGYTWAVHGRLAAVTPTGAAGYPLALWDLETGTKLHELPDGAGVVDVAFAGDGRRVAVAYSDRTIGLWDTGTGARLASIHGVISLGIDLDLTGRALLVWMLGGGLKLLDAETGQLARTFDTGPEEVTAASLSRDGQFVLAGDRVGNGRLFSFADGNLVRAFPRLGGEVTVAALSADGTRALLATADKTLLYDLRHAAHPPADLRQLPPEPLGGRTLQEPPLDPELPPEPGRRHGCPRGARPAGDERLVWCVSVDGRPRGDMIVFGADRKKLVERSYYALGAAYVERTFYPDGAPATATTYRGGVRTGEHTAWFPNGVVRTVGAYEDDQPTGTWIKFDEAGRRMEQE